MATEKVGIKEKMTIKKETIDKEGNVIKRIFFYPDLNVRVEASSQEEADKIAKEVKKDG